MKIIAHRGNLSGENPLRENSLDYVEEAISEGFDVEIDLWHKDYQFYLGHDEPQYHVPMSWLVKYKDVLWIHCKDIEALEKISSSPIEFNYLWHENDRYTLTSKGFIWVLVGQTPVFNSILVLPERTEFDMKNIYGICTDYAFNYIKK